MHTGQHYDPELSEVFFEELGLPSPLPARSAHRRPRRRCGLPGIRAALARSAPGLGARLRRHELDARRRARRRRAGVPLAHVEAGLRSGDLTMPEEHNRIEVDRIAQLLLCPDERSRGDARAEGVAGRRRGRRRRDGRRAPALRADRARALDDPRAARARAGQYVVATIHREANVGRSGCGGSSTGSTRSTSRSSSRPIPRTRARDRRAGDRARADVRLSSRSATSTSPRSPRRRA